MQYMIVTAIPTILIIIFTSILSTYLLREWYTQETRLYTDLPLIFGISFSGLVAVMALQFLYRTEIVVETLELFRLRALMVGVITLPMFVAILHIWLQKYQKQHPRIVGVVFVYWVAMTLLGTSSGMIITAVMPVMLIMGVVLMATFVITWKTGRLQEVRSGLLVIGLGITLSSQVMRVPFDAIGLGIIVDLVLALGMVTITIALTNPWKKF